MSPRAAAVLEILSQPTRTRARLVGASLFRAAQRAHRVSGYEAYPAASYEIAGDAAEALDDLLSERDAAYRDEMIGASPDERAFYRAQGRRW